MAEDRPNPRIWQKSIRRNSGTPQEGGWTRPARTWCCPSTTSLRLVVAGIERPSTEPPRERYIYYPDTTAVPEGVAANVRGRSYKILANVEVGDDCSGVIFAHGSRFGGHSLFIKDKKLYYVYNFLGIPPEQKFVSDKELAPGKYTLGVEFIRESAGEYHESHGTAKLYIDDKVVAEGPMRTQTGKFTLCGDGLCVGRDSATPRSTRPRPRASLYWRRHPVCGGIGGEGAVS
ncbi:MAG: hypothetical protein R2838_13705 [Caldilineaceae bacterium]